MSAPKILPAAAYALSDLAGTVQSVYLHHNAAMDAVGRARGGVVEDLVTRSQVQALELEVARLRDRENITSGELITGDELASGMQALRARLAEIELAEELAEDIIEAQRAVVQQLASQTTCDWPGKCRHQRPASAAAPELEPSGWKVAPVDPTPEMIDAADSVNWCDGDTRGSAINMWHLMLAAAPERAEPVQGPVWLTDERIAQIAAQTWGSAGIAPQSAAAFARAIEAWMLGASSPWSAAPERAADLGENIIEAQRAQIRTLTAERDAALAQAREVLREVEWVSDEIPYATLPDYHRCPSCWAERREGHASDCKLNAALAKGK
jgi:hypothetical protein